jgi:hypothetical protein
LLQCGNSLAVEQKIVFIPFVGEFLFWLDDQRITLHREHGARVRFPSAEVSVVA